MRNWLRIAWMPVFVLLAACGSSPEKTAEESPPPPPKTKVATAPAEKQPVEPVLPSPDVQVVAPVPRQASVPDAAASSSETPVPVNYQDHPAAARLIDKLAREEGFKRAHLQQVLARTERQQWILDLVNRSKVKSSSQAKRPKRPNGSWLRYRAKFLTAGNVSKGIGFWHRHHQVLRRAQAKYGVPPEYVVAIIGIETRYGGYLGKQRVIDALATLAFDYPRRAKFFTGELESFLIMCRNEGLDPFKPKGSYAGAMGLGQFMPSSFHNWAVDFDRNGKRDLWNPVDTIGSVANYFASHGWRKGEPVTIRAATSNAGAVAMKTGYSTGYSPKTLSRAGITVPDGLEDSGKVSLIELDIGNGYEYWLGLKNFYVITRYNHSSYYAMAVHQLAQALKSRRDSTGTVVAQNRAPDRPASSPR
ncbi:MAG: lytic murein transglycosylase B [Candidatus Thiosymbion ectosymbiont of Robbea hypermnestra]|nr:lytic murein transglycosylase B [Candidatus Thiosymbion ectosymbiont of Robbea hypermnestra]